MAIVRDPRSTWKYVLLRERALPREEQTVWELSHLSLAEEHALCNNLVRDPATGMAVRQALGNEQLQALRCHLKGWTNLKNDTGTEIPFEAGPYGGAKDELLMRIRMGDRIELARAIEDEIEFNPDELGK